MKRNFKNLWEQKFNINYKKRKEELHKQLRCCHEVLLTLGMAIELEFEDPWIQDSINKFFSLQGGYGKKIPKSNSGIETRITLPAPRGPRPRNKLLVCP